MTRTPWYSARDHKPVRVGWYDYRGHGLPQCRAWWDCAQWLDENGVPFEIWPWDKWRGLTEECRG